MELLVTSDLVDIPYFIGPSGSNWVIAASVGHHLLVGLNLEDAAQFISWLGCNDHLAVVLGSSPIWAIRFVVWVFLKDDTRDNFTLRVWL
jgi:hypothetical protein